MASITERWRAGTLAPAVVAGVLVACAGPVPSRDDESPQGEPGPVAGYEGTGRHALLEPVSNRRGGSSGGFGDELSFADFAYRLGTGGDAVPAAEVDDLLSRHGEQIGLTGDHLAALRRALGERPAFAAWSQLFAEGGQVRPFQPVQPRDLARIPPKRLALVGNGRYMPEHLVILSPPDETEMEGFLFHEIQHYVLDRWDAVVFEAGAGLSADHEVIEMLEERRDVVEAFRAGRVPRDPRSARVLHDRDGRLTADLGARRWAEAVKRARSEAFYRGWVDATVQAARAQNENNRRIRMVTLELSDGTSLLLDERSDRDAPDDVKVGNMRIPPHYRHGPVIYVSVADLGRFDLEAFLSERHVPATDQATVRETVEELRWDRSKGREHIFTEPQLRDLAHLAAYNAAIFQQALRLGARLREISGGGLEEVMKGEAYQEALSRFLPRLADRLATEPATDPRAAALRIGDEIVDGVSLR